MKVESKSESRVRLDLICRPDRRLATANWESLRKYADCVVQMVLFQ